MFLVNSRHRLVTATPNSSPSLPDHHQGHTFSRSYGANLQSSLTTVLSSALGFSPCPPVSVCGTEWCDRRPAAFLGSMGSSATRHPKDQRSIVSRPCGDAFGFVHPRPTYLDGNSLPRTNYPSPSPLDFKPHTPRTGILTCLPSPTPLGLGLGSD